MREIMTDSISLQYERSVNINFRITFRPCILIPIIGQESPTFMIY